MPGTVSEDKTVNKINERLYYMILHNYDTHLKKRYFFCLHNETQGKKEEEKNLDQSARNK